MGFLLLGLTSLISFNLVGVLEPEGEPMVLMVPYADPLEELAKAKVLDFWCETAVYGLIADLD